MLVQQVLLIAWAGYFAVKYGVFEKQSEALGMCSVFMMTIAAFYWYLMGTMITGENVDLSPRVKRSLPKTGLGRMVFTWFNPGPGTGYFFAISNLLAVSLIALFGIFCWTVAPTPPRGNPTPGHCIEFVLLLFGYVTIYLGLTHLLLRLIRRLTQVTVVTAVLINFLILMAGWGIPRVIREMTDYSNDRSYTYLHVTDPFWSCVMTVDPGASAIDGGVLVWLVLPVAIAVLFACLINVAPELQHEWTAPPQRVEEEDTALAAALHPPQHVPANPWDEGD